MFGQRNGGFGGQAFFDVANEFASIDDGTIHTAIDDKEAVAGGIAAQAEMLAGDLLVTIESEVDDAAIAAAADADFVLGDEIDLWSGVVLVADLGVDSLGKGAIAHRNGVIGTNEIGRA